jgi:hypothetical protein
MELRLYDITMPSINPTSLLGTLGALPPTGGGQVVVGSSTTPGLAVPTVEPIYRIVSDIGLAGVVAAQGLLVVQQFVATNTGGAQFQVALANAANQPFPRFSYGIVVSPPTPVGGPGGTYAVNVGGQSMICVEGMAYGTAGTGGWTVGALLGTAATGTRGVLVTGATGAGAVLGISISTPTVGNQGLMKVGGY